VVFGQEAAVVDESLDEPVDEPLDEPVDEPLDDDELDVSDDPDPFEPSVFFDPSELDDEEPSPSEPVEVEPLDVLVRPDPRESFR